ncbi:hypothetical protein [Sphingomonas sp. 28-62-20]|uniref:hypothetical protein n=1 Tax=Sphingomonas sp. 28-62-20 TaxID=1970433 RepID=UPI0035A946E9
MSDDHLRRIAPGKFVMDVTLPNPKKGDFKASENQIRAVQEFYGPFASNSLTDHQCHVLLSVRSYSRAVTKSLLPSFEFSQRENISRIAATLLLKDPQKIRAVLVWSGIQWHRQPDDPTVIRTKYYSWLIAELKKIIVAQNL